MIQQKAQRVALITFGTVVREHRLANACFLPAMTM
jgi:hypothetical protein